MSDYNLYTQSINEERLERDRRMTSNERNWLSLAGLFWLEEGDNPFGSASGNKIQLEGFPLEHCGTLHMQAGQVSLSEAAASITLNGSKPTLRLLAADVEENPDLVEAGPIRLMVIKRGERTLLRAWDVNSQTVKEFHGLRYFAVDPKWRIPAIFEPYDPPKTIHIQDMIGGSREGALLGRLRFNLNGHEYALEIEDADDEGLISFTDETRKDLTYPGGRYLTLPKPIEENTTLDFNRAHNWPCAYTSWATCPLPPQGNHLPVRVEAGEKRYHD